MQKNGILSKLFPNLISYQDSCTCVPALSLRDYILKMRSQQITSLGYIGSYFPNFNKINYACLEELNVHMTGDGGANGKIHLIDLQSIVDTGKLNKFSIIFEAESALIEVKRLIYALFDSECEVLEFDTENLQFQRERIDVDAGSPGSFKDTLSSIERALFEIKNKRKKQIILNIYDSAQRWDKFKGQFVMLDMPRIINGCEASSIENYVIKFGVGMKSSDLRKKNCNLMEKWNKSHLIAFTGQEQCKQIMISNKTCKINGYSARWILRKCHLLETSVVDIS